MNYNKVIVVGRLTRDPELRYTPSGTPLCKVGLAINRTYKQDDEKKEETTFIDVTIWGKLAELMGATLEKGKSILVEGRLAQDRWETDDGQKRSKHHIVAEVIQYANKPGGDV